jgi:nucleoside-diphosphate kinase
VSTERTLSILKPDATRRNLTGKINAKFEDAGLRIVAQKRIQLSRKQAEQFYAVHAARPFYGELVDSMTAGPVVVQVLEGENAMARNREIMGATNPANADAGTIRKEFAVSVGENSVHGSDSLDNAKIEISFFFSETEIVG